MITWKVLWKIETNSDGPDFEVITDSDSLTELGAKVRIILAMKYTTSQPPSVSVIRNMGHVYE